MSPKLFGSLSAVVLILCCNTVTAQIYKWTDENGKVQFSDKPPANTGAQSSTVENINIKVSPSAPEPIPAAAAKSDVLSPNGVPIPDHLKQTYSAGEGKFKATNNQFDARKIKLTNERTSRMDNTRPHCERFPSSPRCAGYTGQVSSSEQAKRKKEQEEIEKWYQEELRKINASSGH